MTGRSEAAYDPPEVRTKRIYEKAEIGDGYRILIDHVWPRGISKKRVRLDEWAPELAPSDELRKWFYHLPARYAKFAVRYRHELLIQSKRLDELRRRAATGPLTIPNDARDQEHNNAVVLAELLRDG